MSVQEYEQVRALNTKAALNEALQILKDNY